MDPAHVQHYLFGLLAIGNNIPALGAFLAQTQGMSRRQVWRVILSTSAVCLIALLLFMACGLAVLRVFGITISSFQIAGGLLLGLLGLEMMGQGRAAPTAEIPAATELQATEAQAAGAFHRVLTNAVVPIGIPLTVGAGTFSAVVLFANTAARNGTSDSLLIAILALVLINALVFRFAGTVMRRLGSLGLMIFTRIMGLFTLAIGVEFVVRGLSSVAADLMTP
ncbi:MAG: MarC family protein [Cyanobacteriota bacterium]|nr:MarC family protein [Cyanobacteriota bacterium]